mmetsp:Transcript_38447/g.105914  ORF Transcript_38447/g.105914 Transcript_38447/m.105914 type:complete len:315 (-) Transcript_38447:862-1806(-)
MSRWRHAEKGNEGPASPLRLAAMGISEALASEHQPAIFRSRTASIASGESSGDGPQSNASSPLTNTAEKTSHVRQASKTLLMTISALARSSRRRSELRIQVRPRNSQTSGNISSKVALYLAAPFAKERVLKRTSLMRKTRAMIASDSSSGTSRDRTSTLPRGTACSAACSKQNSMACKMSFRLGERFNNFSSNWQSSWTACVTNVLPRSSYSLKWPASCSSCKCKCKQIFRERSQPPAFESSASTLATCSLLSLGVIATGKCGAPPGPSAPGQAVKANIMDGADDVDIPTDGAFPSCNIPFWSVPCGAEQPPGK